MFDSKIIWVYHLKKTQQIYLTKQQLTCRANHLSPFYHQLQTLFLFWSITNSKEKVNKLTIYTNYVTLITQNIYRKLVIHKNTDVSNISSILILSTSIQCKYILFYVAAWEWQHYPCDTLYFRCNGHCSTVTCCWIFYRGSLVAKNRRSILIAMSTICLARSREI